MKTKSSYHRSQNTFRFQTFSERIACVNIDVIRRIERTGADSQDVETFFGEALEKWSELNCTQHFSDFRKEISGQVQSFAQLVHHKEEIVEALKTHLQVKNSLAYQPLLDLVVQLARDLQTDFYPYFRSFFDIIVSLLNTHSHDTELLEQAFTCLSYLFKFLWRYLVKDVEGVFKFYSPLLGQNYKPYINNFAAESFAFLMRKVKDHGKLFDFLFKSLEENPDQVSGVGQLLFEMIKGVRKQFHSCAEKLLPVVISKLGPHQDTEDHAELQWELVLTAITHMMESMTEYTSKEYSVNIVNILCDATESMHSVWQKESKKNKPKVCCQLERLMKVMLIWTRYKEAVLIIKPEKLCNTLQTLLKGGVLQDDCTETLFKMVSSLLLGNNCKLSVQDVSKLVSLVYKTKCARTLIFDFTTDMFDMNMFEKDILPVFLQYCHDLMSSKDSETKDDCLYIITKLLLNKLSPGDEDGLEIRKLYPLDFNMALRGKSPRNTFMSHVISLLDVSSGDKLKDSSYLAKIWSALMCLPHLRPIPADECEALLRNLFVTVYHTLKDALDKEAVLFVLYQATTALSHICPDEKLLEILTTDTVIDMLKCHPTSIHALKLGDVYFSKASSCKRHNLLTEVTANEIFPVLQYNLSSHHSRVRVYTLHILYQFKLPLCNAEEVDYNAENVFKICLDAELVPVTVQGYREKLMHLRKLDYDIVKNNLPVGNYREVPLRYLLGALFVNFNLLWEPLTELLKSQACGLDKEAFWAVYVEALKLASDHTEQELKVDAVSDDETPIAEDTTFCSLFSCQNLKQIGSSKDRPDYNNYRYFLWKAMHKFPEQSEQKTRELTPLLLQFLYNEFYAEDLNVAPTQDLRAPNDITNEDIQNDQLEEDLDNTLDNSQSDDVLQTDNKAHLKTKRKRRSASKNLVVHLTLFSKFKSPLTVYQEPKLKTLYYEFIQHRDPDIQRVALDCIFTYHYKFLTPYRENFDRLLDNKTFKNEIVLFSIDAENGIVEDTHRKGLLPILMRILYGKMNHKTGKDTSGKAQSQIRKGIVFRFLAGCQQQELKVFMDLVFEPFQQYAADSVLSAVKKIKTSIDYGKVIPLKKIQGVLNTIDVIYKKLGNLIDQYLPGMFHITVCLTVLCVQLLENRERVQPKAVNMLKMIRQLGINRITQFFADFESYPFTPEELDAVFEVSIWPQLDRLPFEGLYHPTPMLKLFNLWSQRPRYFQLFSKYEDSNESLTPLPYIFQLLLAKTCSEQVVTMIMEMVENLLVYADFEPSDDTPVVEVNTCLDVDKDVDGDRGEPASYGTCLLLPHVPVILQHLKRVVENMAKQKTKKHSFPVRDLNILSKLSVYVTDPEQSATLVNLLLPFLERNITRSQDIEVDILTTVANLVKRVENPASFLEPLCKLFSTVTERTSRMALCDVLQGIASRDKTVQELSSVVTQLNSWDKRRVDEPDYMVRLDAYKKVNQCIQQMETLDTVYIEMIIYNCSFFLVSVDDLSIRDSSSFCLQEIVKKLSDCDEVTFKKLIGMTLLNEIQMGIKNKMEVVRHEFLNILSLLVKTYPDHPCFSDLVQLMNTTDIEVDFFENIRHIQTHRRSRALKRLTKHLSGHKMKPSTLTSYLLPITTSFITDESYSKAQHLLDVAVETIGAICRQLPWQSYLQVLRKYLNQLPKTLDNQKLMVKIIVAVLDAFHFDLSKSDAVHSELVASASKDGELPVDENNEEENAETVTEVLETETNAIGHDSESLSGSSSSGETESNWQTTVCPPGLANKIHHMIVRSIVPQLHRCLTQKAKSDGEHKMAQTSKYAEDEEVLRVPIALAMVKLLQNLPKGTLELSLPGVLIKVCQFLKSRSKDIRNITRDTLLKIVDTLGAPYFSFVLSELRSALTRGYQLHVLSFTVHALLKSMDPTLKPGDLDFCMTNLIQVFNEELFGQVSEEKEVQGITGKLFEAKSSKSYDSYEILAKFVTKTSLTQLIVPLKEILDTTHSHKTCKKIQEILKRVGYGLIENQALTEEMLLIFIHGLASETMPLLADKTKSQPAAPPPDPRLQPRSTYLLPETPKRGGPKPSSSSKTNLHILVEFGLQLLFMLLKRSRVQHTNTKHLQMMDPFVSILTNCLVAKYIRVTTTSLRCLCWVLKWPLPSLKDHVEQLANSLFVLLKNYAVVGAAAQGDNFELVVMCFKAVTVLVREVKSYTISSEQLQVLLNYAEQDIHDHTRQATAFNLLKAIFSRKLVLPEMHDIIKKVATLSITAPSPHVRLQSRQVVLQFLLDYPLGRQLKKHLEFYVMQLGYELETGRESALEMLATMFSSFPQGILLEYAGFFFVPMAARLVNDESAKCRKLTAFAIKSLLEKISHEKRDELFNITVLWLQDSKVAHKRLASQLCGLFVEVESTKFERHLSTILPIMEEIIEPSRYEKSEEAGFEREADHLLFNLLTALGKIVKECDLARGEKWAKHMNGIWESVQTHLLYAHAWVRLAAAQLVGLLFAAWSPEELAKTKSRREYIQQNTPQKIEDLASSFTMQLKSELLDEELADQVVKNLVFVAKAIRSVSLDSYKTLTWLIRRMAKQAKYEASQNQKISLKRSCVFKWMAAVSLDLGKSNLPDYLDFMLPPLYAASIDTSLNADSSLKSLSQEVLDMMKGIVGVEVFTKHYSTVHKKVSDKKESRKRQKALDAVSNPEIAAKKKMKKNLAKKEAKKRKIEGMRPSKASKASKKKKLSQLAITD